jgi:hypothetical protein
VEQTQGHLTDKAHQGLENFIRYAELENCPEDVFDSVRPPHTRKHWNSAVFKELVENWEGASFNEIRSLAEKLLQSKGISSKGMEKDFKRIIRSEKELKFLRGLILFAASDRTREEKQIYNTTIKNTANKVLGQ